MASQRIDPIRLEFFSPLDRVEKINDVIFYLGAIASLATLLVDKSTAPNLYQFIHAIFIVLVVSGWCLGILVRIYLWPRAQNRRFRDFVSHAFGIQLASNLTQGYYNSSAIGDDRIGAQVLENAFHSKDTATQMIVAERIKVGIFLLLLTLAILHRRTDLGFIAIVAQAIFSEQMLSRWIRLEWLRLRFESIFDELYRLFIARPAPQAFHAEIFELVVQYESVKANAAISLSERIFKKRNADVSLAWDRIRQQLKL